MLSTPVLLAASISTMSRMEPRLTPWHTSQVPQGVAVGVGLLRQLRDLARMRALEVLPVPRGPQKR